MKQYIVLCASGFAFLLDASGGPRQASAAELPNWCGKNSYEANSADVNALKRSEPEYIAVSYTHLDVYKRQPLDSCNYECAYCPFAKRAPSVAKLDRDRQALSRFVAWLLAEHGFSLRVLFTPCLLYTSRCV